MHIKIENAIGDLIREIKQYESDTFSAEGENISHQEAQLMAAELIKNVAEAMGMTIDGIQLTGILHGIRYPSEQ